MKIFLTTFCVSALSVGTALGLADAAPGDGQLQDHIEILEQPSFHCPVRGSVCLTVGARSTVAAPSAAAAALDGHPAAGAPPRFSRVDTAAKNSREARVDDSVPWTLDLSANLRHRALAGNALFLIYDAENPKAMASREVTAMWQAPIPAGDKIAARLTLSPEDGFRPGHAYRIRVVQLVRGKEVILADGQVKLL